MVNHSVLIPVGNVSYMYGDALCKLHITNILGNKQKREPRIRWVRVREHTNVALYKEHSNYLHRRIYTWQAALRGGRVKTENVVFRTNTQSQLLRIVLDPGRQISTVAAAISWM